MLALLAAGLFPESVVHDIESRGTAFVVDDDFSSLARVAGADAVVMAALRKLGRTEEAAKLEQRTQSIQSEQSNPN